MLFQIPTHLFTWEAHTYEGWIGQVLLFLLNISGHVVSECDLTKVVNQKKRTICGPIDWRVTSQSRSLNNNRNSVVSWGTTFYERCWQWRYTPSIGGSQSDEGSGHRGIKGMPRAEKAWEELRSAMVWGAIMWKGVRLVLRWFVGQKQHHCMKVTMRKISDDCKSEHSVI